MDISVIKREGERKELKLQIFQRCEDLKKDSDSLIRSDLTLYPTLIDGMVLALTEIQQLYAEYVPIVNVLTAVPNGVSATTTTTLITLTFDVDPATLDLEDISIVGATLVSLAGTGLVRTLEISTITVADSATIDITFANPVGFNINPNVIQSVVYKV